MQALQKYKDTAIAESERIEEQFDDLIKDFNVDSSFTFHIGLDIQPTHSWKAPYKDIKVDATHHLMVYHECRSGCKHNLPCRLCLPLTFSCTACGITPPLAAELALFMTFRDLLPFISEESTCLIREGIGAFHCLYVLKGDEEPAVLGQVEVASLGGAEEDAATVDTKILQLRKNKGTMKLVAGRPLQLGDVAIVDFSTVRTDTNEEIRGSQRKGMQLDTGLGDRALGLVGATQLPLTSF